MMDWFHNYCSQHHLTYYMIGGTMLGAVRHQGFIPWDDDIDVGMPREDYFRFVEMMEGKIVDHFTVETFRSNHLDFCYPFAKMYDISTTLVEDRNPPLKRGLYLDVFPIDGANDSFVWRAGYRLFRLRKNMLAILTAKESDTFDAKTNLAIRIVSVFKHRCEVSHYLLKRIDKFCASVPFSVDGIAANLVGSRKEKELLPGAVFGKPTQYLFEGKSYYGVELADKYLSMLIGNYMELPPESERRGHLISACDFAHGYMS
jgi:lipopolysaccharide cholinephosphotransferase